MKFLSPIWHNHSYDPNYHQRSKAFRQQVSHCSMCCLLIKVPGSLQKKLSSLIFNYFHLKRLQCSFWKTYTLL